MSWIKIPTTEWLETENHIIDAFNYIHSVKHNGIGYDTETTGVVIFRDYPLLASFSDGVRRFACEATWLTHPLVSSFLEGDSPKIGSNLKFDLHMTSNLGINIQGPLWDTLVMDFLLDENRKGRHGLKDLALDYCGIIMKDFKEVFPMIRKRKGTPDDTAGDAIKRKMSTPEGKQEAIDYSGLDAYASVLVFNYLKAKLSEIYIYESISLFDYFIRIEAPFTRVLWNLERRGFTICSGYFKQMEIPLSKAINEAEAQFNLAAGRQINLKSPQQLRQFFYETLGKAPTKLTKGGESGNKQPSTDTEVLEEWAEEGDTYAKLMLEYRSLTKTFDTYVSGIGDLLDNSFKLHTTLNQHIAVTGRLSSKEPNCFDKETEILTNRGWVKFPDLTLDYKVAQWKKGDISFVKPKIVIKHYKGNLKYLANDHINLLVTPEHRCLLQHRNNEFLVFEAFEYPEGYKQLHSGIYGGKGLKLTNDEIRILCAIQADGCYSSNGIDFTFKRERKIERLLQLCKNEKIPISHNANLDGTYRIRFLKSKRVEKFYKYLGSNKEFGPWILAMSREQLDLFIEEIYNWDGSFTRKNSYSSNNIQNANWVQIANILSGKRANTREHKYGENSINYRVDITDKNHSMTTNIERQDIPYEGNVYCVSVPSSYIIVRRQGKVCVTGNCQNIPRPANDKFKLRDGFIATPFFRLIVADYAQLEMMILAHKSNDPIMVQAIIDGKDLHCLAVSLIFGVPYDEVVEAKNTEKKGISLSVKQRRLLDLRQAMKNVGYGIVYGIGAIKLGHDLTEEFQKADKTRIVTEEEAQGYIDAWFNLFKTVKDFINYEKKYVKEYQYVQTFLRRFRRLPQIKSSKFKDRLQAERQAVNIIQGDAADIVKIAMLAVESNKDLNGMGYKQLLQVHDEIVGECPDDDILVKECKKIVKYLMEESFNNTVFKLRVPLKAEINDGYSWSSAK